jgi:hypothetical protein
VAGGGGGIVAAAVPAALSIRVGGPAIQFDHQPVTPVVDVLIVGSTPSGHPPLPEPRRQAMGLLYAMQVVPLQQGLNPVACSSAAVWGLSTARGPAPSTAAQSNVPLLSGPSKVA